MHRARLPGPRRLAVEPRIDVLPGGVRLRRRAARPPAAPRAGADRRALARRHRVAALRGDVPRARRTARRRRRHRATSRTARWERPPPPERMPTLDRDRSALAGAPPAAVRHARRGVRADAARRTRTSSPSRPRHLTVHGANQNEDGTYSWKFDNYVHAGHLLDLTPEEVRRALGATSRARCCSSPAPRAGTSPMIDERRSSVVSATPATCSSTKPATGSTTTNRRVPRSRRGLPASVRTGTRRRGGTDHDLNGVGGRVP